MADDKRSGGILPSGRAGRWWQLLLAVLIVAAVGVGYIWKFNTGARGHELLQFFTIYLAVPLAIGLLTLFAYLKNPAE